jgi:UDP-glucose 4-epimerase
MKITVFGGSGFLGSHVCDQLSEAGHQVTIYDQIASPWIRDNQQMIVGDILDPEKVLEAVSGKDMVYNFAGIADIAEANKSAVDTIKYNILSNTYILDACVECKIKRFIFASTLYVYSNAGGFYRCSKQACENYIENYYQLFGLEYTVLRYGSLYGPRDNRNAIYRFVKEALESDTIHYYGSPEALREYIHVIDAAKSSVKMLESSFSNQYVMITGHQPMRVGDVLKMIAEIINKPLEFVFDHQTTREHYEVTPYSFNPKLGAKYAPPLHVDFGQGILKVIEEQYKTIHNELYESNGILVKED